MDQEGYGLRESHPSTEDPLGIKRKEELIKYYTEIGSQLLAGQLPLKEFAIGQAENHLQREVEAEHDPLTGLPNRRGFMSRIDDKLLSFRRTLHPMNKQYPAQTPGCLAILDLDNFGLVNKKYGDHVGDAVLQQVAAVLTEGVRPEDLIARFGGEELVIFLSGARLEDAQKIIERIRKDLPHKTADGLRNLGFVAIEQTASFGVVQIPENLSEEGLKEPAERSRIFSEAYTQMVSAMRYVKKVSKNATAVRYGDGRMEIITPPKNSI